MEKLESKVIVENKVTESFTVSTGERQGDALSTSLFNLILHKAVNKSQITGTIAKKTQQIFGYADDIALIGRNIVARKELFHELEKEGKKIGLI